MKQLDVLLNVDLHRDQKHQATSARNDVERLPFTLRLVRSENDLQKAVSIRHDAYARHVPELAQVLREPEDTDFERGVVVLLAESNLNGMPLGTMRIQTNLYAPLIVEQSIQLPPWLKGRRLAEATRLGITHEGVGRVVKTALFKAYYQFSHYAGIEEMVIAGRRPIDRQYERLLFEDVYPGQGYIPLRHANNIPHRVMSLAVRDVEPKWKAAEHSLYKFFFETTHPDILPNQGNISAYLQQRGYCTEEAKKVKVS
jgi:hypothetical protein